jgi:hypothetical protein
MADILRITWEGHNGKTWDLINPTSPTFAVSIQGMGMPGFTHQWTVSGARDGQRYEGTDWNAHHLTLTVQVGDTYTAPGFTRRRTGADWRALDRDFRRSFSAEHEGRFVVETESGRRHLPMRLDDVIPPPSEENPALRGTATYVIALIAGDEPMWIGEPIGAQFQWSTDTTSFFVADGGTVPDDEVDAFISEDAAINAANLINPGDREAYPVWWAEGPVDEVQVGVGDQYVVLPFSIAEGKKVYVDSFRETITNEQGESLWPLMGFADAVFPPIPPEGEAALHVAMIGATGNAKIGVTITPRYDWPW